MDAVLETLGRAAATGLIPSEGSVLLAVSGGADSMGLLYGAAEVAATTSWRLTVGHVHHGWPERRRDADRDLASVADHARRLGLPFASRRCDARRAAAELGLSPEAGARHVRYAALAEMARDAGAPWIATAHQRDDVLESYLLARERRGGLAGLAGPRRRRDDGVVRPLLGVRRSEIVRFLAARGVPFRRDASNGDLRLARNRVRRELSGLSEEQLAALWEEVDRLGRRRDRVELRFAEELAPALRFAADLATADAGALSAAPPELRRIALERLAAPFARAGGPPFSGREREQIVRLLGAGADFRFEAGRRIRFVRRGGILTVGPRALRTRGRGRVYDSPHAPMSPL